MFACWIGLALGASAATKVAVIGDSISTGAAAENPATNGYPAVLDRLLGDDYDVRAFAIGGHTLVRKSRASLMWKPVYREALDFAPDLAVVMLGTNDSNSGGGDHWQYQADLETDLLAMVSDLRKSNPQVLIHIAGPPPMYPDKSGLGADRVANLTERHGRLAQIRERFGAIATKEPGVLIHDLARVFGPEETTDGVHPTTAGHAKLAAHLAEILTLEFDEGCRIGDELKSLGAKCGDFHGFERYDFRPAGLERDAIIVAPKQAAVGRPWIWRARFFGHQPALDLQLLDRGWHLAYVDVVDLYGGPEAMRIWDAFHRFATDRLGLSAKPVLEGMSRGGLPVFHWAIRHPDRVTAIYGDNPVCDFRTWPGGLDGSRGSKRDWVRLLAAWGLDKEQAKTHPQVADRLEPLAAAKVPVALVIGTADKVVPPAANAERVATRYEELGGPVKVWRKEGSRHHPHGLHPPDELRAFLIESWRTAQSRGGP